MPNTFSLPLATDEFAAILHSHGWYRLAPCAAELTPPRLRLPFALPQGRGVVELGGTAAGVRGQALAGDLALCRAVAATCLSLEVDRAALRAVAQAPHWRWLEARRLGRFLRSPTLFEDGVKILLTVNTTFRRTEVMADALVAAYGAPVAGSRAFPTPAALLRAGEEAVRAATRCGYRAPFLLHLARHAQAQPAIFLGEGWRGLSPEEFTARLAAVPGLGPVSVGYLARMYGKPTGYAVDAYVRRRCRELWGVESDAALHAFIADRYAPCGSLGPTIFWFELTRYWHEGSAYKPADGEGQA